MIAPADPRPLTWLTAWSSSALTPMPSPGGVVPPWPGC